MSGKSYEDRIVDLAQRMLSGDVGLVEGSRQLVYVFGQLDERDEDLLAPIIAVESETEDFPLGEARNHWSEEALKRKDAEVADYLREVKVKILGACEALVQRYS